MVQVAVITRTKDRPLFLKRAVLSVAHQTIGDYAHVIVSDGGSRESVDEALAGLDEAARSKVKVFHREASSGAPDTIFNESIDRVDSTYVAIHDDDDTWHPEFLERTLAVLESGAKGVVVRTDRVYEEVGETEIKHAKTKQYMPNLTEVSLYQQCTENQLTPIAFIYRRDVYEEIGKYDESLPVAGDWEFGLRFLRRYDVEFLDPGFALAGYHERKKVKDNSFATHDHRKYLIQVANKYLREDLDKGGLGLGYIISKLKYDQDARHKLVKQVLPKPLLKHFRKRK